MRLELKFVIFLSLITIGLSREKKRKALIISVDEKNPEKSDALIYNLTLQEQASSPKHRIIGRPHGRTSNEKEIGYIIVTPEDLKRIQDVDGISIEEPRYLTYPSSTSEENYDSGKYPQSLPVKPVYSQSDSGEYYNSPEDRNKYPLRPAPPLHSLSSPNSSYSGYGPSSEPNYNSPPANHYSSYGSEEIGGPGGSSHGSSHYGSNDSPYNSPTGQGSYYESEYPPPKEYAQNPGSYESYPTDKGNGAHHSDTEPVRPMYSGYKPPYTSMYGAKYESGPAYSGPKESSYSPYSNPETTHGYGDSKYISPSKPYSKPREVKFSEPPYRSVGKPLSDTSDSHTHHYGNNATPTPYDTSYNSPGPNSVSSYGSRTKSYSSPTSSYTGAHSSPHTNSDISPKQHPSKDSSYGPKHSYSDSHTYKNPVYDHSDEHTYKKPKSSYSHSPPISSSYSPKHPYTDSHTDHSPEYHHSDKHTYNKPKSSNSHSSPTSYNEASYSGASKARQPQPYRSPLHYSFKYPQKPYYTSYEKPPKESYDPATYKTYGSETFPSKYTSFTKSDGRAYDPSTPYSSKTLPSYKISSQPDSPVVTRFYETPTPKPATYDSKYPESHRTTPLVKPKHYDSSKLPAKDKSFHSGKALPYSSSLTVHPTKENYGHKDSTTSRARDTHSVSKNYKPSRPAPLHDEYEQPRYPPLPVNIPQSSSEKDSHEYYSDHTTKDSDYKNKENAHEKPYSSSYNPSPYHSGHIHSNSPSHYPAQNDSSYYSSHEADNEPIIYTKTITKTYSKPSGGDYYEHPSESPYSTHSSVESPSATYYSPAEKSRNNAVLPQYSKPYSQTSEEYSQSEPLSNKGKKFRYYSQDDSTESSPIYISERPQRVEGVVYRHRKTSPSLRRPRKYKNYLPYKVYNPEGLPAIDYKIYENAPEKNSTGSQVKNAIKLKYRPLKKGSLRENFKEESKDDTYESGAFANIPGEAGRDFPILKEIPPTYFSCDNRDSGFYADIENRCQVYHQCSDNGKMESFLCPNGTIFNQLTFVCEWWHNVDCDQSEKHFDKNKELYKTPQSTTGGEPGTSYEPPLYPYSYDPEYSQESNDEDVNKYAKALTRSRRKKLSRRI